MSSFDNSIDSEHEPLVDAASTETWREWTDYVTGAARGRLAGVSLLLLGALLFGAGALWGFAFLAEAVREGETQGLDERVLLWLRHYASPSLDELARIVSLMGSEVVALVLVVLLVYFAWARRWGASIGLVIVTGGVQLLNDVLKNSFHRTRPAPVLGAISAQSWSFPSGHAMVSASFYLFLVYLGWRLLSPFGRAVWAIALIALVFLIGLSRIYLGVHYLTDVLAGYTVGAAWTVAVVLAGRLLVVRRRARRRRRSRIAIHDNMA